MLADEWAGTAVDIPGALALAIKMRPCPTASCATPVTEFYPLFVCALCRPYGPSAAHALAWPSWSVSILASVWRANGADCSARTDINVYT